MDDSIILKDVKTSLGTFIDSAFDNQILSFVDQSILALTELGCIKPLDSPITKDTKWSDIIVDAPKTNALYAIKQYIYLQVKLMFDPPVSGIIGIVKDRIDELYFRIDTAYNCTASSEVTNNGE